MRGALSYVYKISPQHPQSSKRDTANTFIRINAKPSLIISSTTSKLPALGPNKVVRAKLTLLQSPQNGPLVRQACSNSQLLFMWVLKCMIIEQELIYASAIRDNCVTGSLKHPFRRTTSTSSQWEERQTPSTLPVELPPATTTTNFTLSKVELNAMRVYGYE